MVVETLKSLKRSVLSARARQVERRLFQASLRELKNKPIKVVIGSAGICEKGWLPSEAHFLNLLDESDWYTYFSPGSIQNVLAEHIWEHLSLGDAQVAAKTVFKFLKPKGRLRIAVPDGNHHNTDYIEAVRPGGYGAGAEDHKVLYKISSLTTLFENAGFEVHPVEYFDSSHNFHTTPWLDQDGLVRRSLRHDERNLNGNPNYTSLVIDAIKV